MAAYVPWFYPATDADARTHFEGLLEAAGDTPAFLYNIPRRTVNDLSAELAGELAAAGFAGHEGLDRRLRPPRGLPRRHPRRTTSSSTSAPSRSSLRAYRDGAAGAITGLAGARPELFSALRDGARAAGDDAAAERRPGRDRRRQGRGRVRGLDRRRGQAPRRRAARRATRPRRAPRSPSRDSAAARAPTRACRRRCVGSPRGPRATSRCVRPTPAVDASTPRGRGSSGPQSRLRRRGPHPFRPARGPYARGAVIHQDARLDAGALRVRRRRTGWRPSSASRSVLAQVLVRRGLGEPAAARAFLAAADEHPLDAFGGLREAAERILGHVRRRSPDHRPRRLRRRRRLRLRGADPRAAHARRRRRLVPARAAPTTATGSRPRPSTGSPQRGTDLLVTVDCAITAVEEVARARAAGHGRRSSPTTTARARTARCPDAPIVHPRIGGYPCPDLCAAARRAQARAGAAGGLRRGPADGRRGPRPRRARHGRRRRAAAAARTGGSCARACARSPRPASPACAR